MPTRRLIGIEMQTMIKANAQLADEDEYHERDEAPAAMSASRPIADHGSAHEDRLVEGQLEGRPPSGAIGWIDGSIPLTVSARSRRASMRWPS